MPDRAAKRRPAAAVAAVLACAALAGTTAEPLDTARPASVREQVSRAVRLVRLIESFQPRDPAGPPPNRWTQIVRTAFIYSGALHMFASQSRTIRDVMAQLNAGADDLRRVPETDFMLLALGETPAGGRQPDAPAREVLATEARRFLDALERDGLLLHLHQVADPCRLVAPAPFEGVDAALIFQDTFEQGALKNLASACCARMMFAAADSDHHAFIRGFRSGLRLGNAAAGRPMLIALMNAHAIQNRVIAHAARWVRSGRVDASACRDLLAALADSELPPAALFLEIERLIGHDAIDRFFDRRALEQAAAPEGEVSITDLSRSEAMAVYDEAMDDAVRTLTERAGDEPTRADGHRPTLRLPEGRSDPGGLLRSLLPPVAQLRLSDLEHRCHRAGLITAALIELHRRRHGAIPARLEDLDPADHGDPTPPAPPPDPCDPSRPLGYRPAPDGSYLLYSVGADGTDNAGAPPPAAPGLPPRWREALIPQARFTGTDLVIFPEARPDR